MSTNRDKMMPRLDQNSTHANESDKLGSGLAIPILRLASLSGHDRAEVQLPSGADSKASPPTLLAKEPLKHHS